MENHSRQPGDFRRSFSVFYGYFNTNDSAATRKHSLDGNPMKRDMNLIRELLLFYESDCVLPYPTVDGGTITQHIIWLIEAELIAGRLANSSASGSPRSFFPIDGRVIENNGMQCMYFPLTWKGCDFLAAARDETRWNNAMKIVGGFTFETIKTYLQSSITSALMGVHASLQT